MMAIDGTWRRSCILEDASEKRREAERRTIGPVERILPATIIDGSGLPPLPTRMGQRRSDWRASFKGRSEEEDIRSEDLSLIAF
jgi:hypothetical protein